MADPAVLSPRTTADTARTTSNAEAERLARRGNLFSHLILFDLLREEIPASSYDGAEAIIEAFLGEVHAALSRPATACFQTAFGIETYLKTYDALASNLKVCILPVVFDMIRSAAMSIPRGPYHPSLILADDPLAQLLGRLRKFCEDAVERPRLVSNLRPPLSVKTAALSKLPGPRLERVFKAIVQDAKGDLCVFLAMVRDREIQTDGYYPTIWDPRTLSNAGWALISDATMAAREFHIRQGTVALRAFMIKRMEAESQRRAVADKFGVSDRSIVPADLEVLVDTLIGNEGILHLLHRLGAYQDVPGCPFQGMGSEIPAATFKIFLSGLFSTTPSGQKESAMNEILSKFFSPIDDILVRGYRIFQRLTPTLCIPDEAASPAKRRRVLAPVQEAAAALALTNPPQESEKKPGSAPTPPSTPPAPNNHIPSEGERHDAAELIALHSPLAVNPGQDHDPRDQVVHYSAAAAPDHGHR
ncbi:hypothetical protein MVEN_02206100 [Mycena venus]|uniref:Uncharacterized protein n=1 Tax=Mycena venus TaxID=2733690 RepID=A0A8H6X6M9_9AGAR|nr:hypothetical protein MVEN_02206100 [Mycena venus]